MARPASATPMAKLRLRRDLRWASVRSIFSTMSHTSPEVGPEGRNEMVGHQQREDGEQIEDGEGEELLGRYHRLVARVHAATEARKPDEDSTEQASDDAIDRRREAENGGGRANKRCQHGVDN